MRRLAVTFALALVIVAALPSLPANGAREPRCFGAASRDHVKPCHNRRLARMVRPTPAQALTRPNAPCVIPRRQYPLVCEFGAAENVARRRIALIGDSHATHWRAALGPVARKRKWAGFSITRAGCALSASRPKLRDGLTGECLRWRTAVYGWLNAHPGVDTLFVSQHRARVKGGFDAEVAGYLSAWAAVPATIKKIVVIRDTPRRPKVIRGCVLDAMERRVDAGRVCAMRRGAVLGPDPAAEAARRAASRRVRLVDMTRYFCDSSRCWPVVGGALVHKDSTHITATYGATMAPMLGARLSAIGLRR